MKYKKILIALFALFISLTSVEIVFRVVRVVDTQKRQEFVSRAWDWPTDRFSIFDGPLMAAHIAHPFWGFMDNPNLGGMNNYGFDDKVDYPYIKKEGESIIGLLGGSVALRTAPFLDKALRDALKKRLSCEPKIKLLTLAQGAHKQPSQFHIFSYFTETIDVSVNLDGFNDAFLVPGPGAPQAYPLFYNELFLTDSKKMSALKKAYLATKIQHWIARHTHNESFFFDSDFFFWIGKSIFDRLEIRKHTLLKSIKGPLLTKKDIAIVEENIRVWKKYILLQNQISRTTDRPSFFFLQPSQYAKNAKPLSIAEKNMYVTKDFERAQLYEAGYEHLRAAVTEMQRMNIDISDQSMLFASEPATVFSDDCCHLNDKGYRLLAEAMVEKLSPALLKLQKCP